jgi:hypothetical protein
LYLHYPALKAFSGKENSPIVLKIGIFLLTDSLEGDRRIEMIGWHR